MHSNCVDKNGFTLIELLVAISILAIVAVLGYRGLDGIVRSREVITSRLEETRGLQLTFAQMQSDCAQNVNPLSFPNISDGRTSWIEPTRLILIRTEYNEDQNPTMSVVVYRLKNDKLMRFETDSTRDLAELQQFLQQARNPRDDQVEITMQTNVQNIEFAGYPQSAGDSQSGANRLQGYSLPPGANGINPTQDKGGNPEKEKELGKESGAENPQGGQPGGGGAVDPGNNAIQNVNRSSITSGLQVSLQLVNHPNTMTKIFMLGGA